MSTTALNKKKRVRNKGDRGRGVFFRSPQVRFLIKEPSLPPAVQENDFIVIIHNRRLIFVQGHEPFFLVSPSRARSALVLFGDILHITARDLTPITNFFFCHFFEIMIFQRSSLVYFNANLFSWGTDLKFSRLESVYLQKNLSQQDPFIRVQLKDNRTFKRPWWPCTR